MEIWPIVKIVLMVFGGMVVLDHTPGVNLFQDERADYKALVKCEAKSEGLARKCQGAVRSCRATLDELKKEKKENKSLAKKNRKLEKALKTEERDYRGCQESLDRVLSDRHNGGRGRLRGREDRGAGVVGWKKFFPWRGIPE